MEKQRTIRFSDSLVEDASVHRYVTSKWNETLIDKTYGSGLMLNITNNVVVVKIEFT